MTFSASLRYLNSFLNLERITFQPAGRIWNLKRMRRLLDWFGHPEKDFFSVIVAGTKGKGSTGFFLESILESSGVKTGFYSSPHLETPLERIRIRGKMISAREWTEGVEFIRRGLRGKKLPESFGDFTYFEILTLLAILLFKKAGVGAGIFEVGMGGRLDATNALRSRVVLLTPIHLDHEAVLGNTIPKIAREKAAVIHGHADVVVSSQRKEAMREIMRRIRREGARLWKAKSLQGLNVELAGDYQRMNAGTAVLAAQILKKKYAFPVTQKGIEAGLHKKGWPGRMEVVPGNPGFLLDGAHNPISIEALVRNLKKRRERSDLLVFGTSRDKKSQAMLKTLASHFKRCILTPLPNPRSQELALLLAQARGLFESVYPAPDVRSALELARSLSSGRAPVVVTGSFYLIGEAKRILRKGRKGDPPGRPYTHHVTFR